MAQDLTTQPTAEPLKDSPKPADMPDLSGASKEQLAQMLAGGTQAPIAPATPAPEPKPEQPPLEEPAEEEVQVPDKFKNKDGTVNTDNLLKSYLEAEKKLSQSFQTGKDIEDLRKENEEIRQIATQMQTYIERMQSQPQQQQLQPEQTQVDYSDPAQVQKFIDDRINGALNQHMQQQTQELDRQRVEDWKILQSVAEARKSLDGFKKLEPEINKILQAEWIDRHPDSVKFGYYAALGQKAPALIQQAKNMGLTDGYNKAKEELSKGVDTGRSTAPIETGQFSQDQLTGMSKDELYKMLKDFAREGV